MFGSGRFNGFRNGLALPNSGCIAVFFPVPLSPSFACLGDGACILALIFARGFRAGFCGDRYWPDEVLLGLRSLTIFSFFLLRTTTGGLQFCLSSTMNKREWLVLSRGKRPRFSALLKLGLCGEASVLSCWNLQRPGLRSFLLAL